MLLLLIFDFVFLSFHALCVQQHKCVSVYHPSPDTCKLNEENTNAGECLNDISICDRGFNVSYLDLEPYITYSKVIDDIINQCCGTCGNVAVLNTFKSVSGISPTSINYAHIVYPILGRSDATTLYGHYFIPFVDVPGAYYITKKPTKEMTARHLLSSVEDLWPFLVVMLLMAVIAGFLIWVIDTWYNKGEFRRKFHIGLFDGFWWSFISMTTVGYGDKSPKFIVSRLFSVVWILIGMTINSMFTANLTSEINNAVSPAAPTMRGKHVGIVSERMYDFAMVARHGGLAKPTKNLDIKTAVIELIDDLRNESIHGFLLDEFVYSHTIEALKLNETSKHYEYLLTEAKLTPKTFSGEKLSYGLLIKEYEDYHFLKDFVLDNRIGLEACTNNILNVLHTRNNTDKILKNYDIFSVRSGLFELSMTVIGVILAFIICFGIIYEITRSKYKKCKKDELTKSTRHDDLELQPKC